MSALTKGKYYMNQLETAIAAIVAVTKEFSVWDITRELRKKGWIIAHQTVREAFYEMQANGDFDQYGLINDPRLSTSNREYNHYSHANDYSSAATQPTPAISMTDDEIWDKIKVYLMRLEESATAKRIQSRFKKWRITCSQIAEIAKSKGALTIEDANHPSKSVLSI